LLAQGDQSLSWLAKHSRPWLKQWVAQGENGFNPFDALASHYLIAPEDIVSETLQAHPEIHPNDMVSENQTDVFKQYLLCDTTKGYPVKYCCDVSSNFEEKLLETLLK
ncbi:MAG: nucleoside hydrolase, partial [Flavobacteriales bacterium]|nr:nucleoside hydrolase [Flavobacteriales bacterium]